MTLSRASGSVRIGAVGTAVPEMVLTQDESEAVLLARYGESLSPRARSILRKTFQHPSIRTRRFALDHPEQVFDEDPDLRVARFTEQAVRLSATASRRAISSAGVSTTDLAVLVVNTCTGYICPGIATYLLEELGLEPHTRVYDLVGAGCGGAMPNLEVAARLLGDGNSVALSVAVEICSATFQMGEDIGLIVSNAIFGDGAAAAVLWTRPAGMAVVDSARVYAPEHRGAIRYVCRNGQLHNQLSAALPKILRQTVPPVVNGLLERHGLRVPRIRHWAVHPGGEKVVAAVQAGLGLSDQQTRITREILAEYGNMSSPTVLFGLERILATGIEPGEWCVLVSMGAGLSVHACLLRAE